VSNSTGRASYASNKKDIKTEVKYNQNSCSDSEFDAKEKTPRKTRRGRKSKQTPKDEEEESGDDENSQQENGEKFNVESQEMS
jgi:hypothetical protein